MRVPESIDLGVLTVEYNSHPSPALIQLILDSSQNTLVEHYRCLMHRSVITNMCFPLKQTYNFFFSHLDSRVNETAQHTYSHLLNVYITGPRGMLSLSQSQYTKA